MSWQTLQLQHCIADILYRLLATGVVTMRKHARRRWLGVENYAASLADLIFIQTCLVGALYNQHL